MEMMTTSRNLTAAMRRRKAAGKYATVLRYRNPNVGLDANGIKA